MVVVDPAPPAPVTVPVHPALVTSTTTTSNVPVAPDVGMRVRLVTMLAWGLILTLVTDAAIAAFAIRAPEAFKNWDLVLKILDGNATAKTALISGLLGFMARDAVMK